MHHMHHIHHIHHIHLQVFNTIKGDTRPLLGNSMVDIKVKDITGLSAVNFDKSLYSLEELQAAAYLYTEFSSFNFSYTGNEFLVDIQQLPNSDLNSEDIMHLFKNQLFMESLRTKIASKTETERNLILAYAFSNTPLVN